MSFQQGLSGLNAASANLDVIGNNVANSSTVGFKQSQAQFADLYANSLAGAGGLNIGLGVKVADVAQQFSQGNITTTNNPFDIAINGPGFFRMSQNGAITYTRNGQFHTDKDGFLVNANDQRVTGFGAGAGGVLGNVPVELQIPAGDLVPQATTDVDAVLNLDSRAGTLPPAGFDLNDPLTYNSSTSVGVFDTLGNAHTLSTYYVKSAANTWQVFAALDGTQVGAAAVGTLNFTTDGVIDTATTTLPFNVSALVGTGAATPLAFSVDFAGSTQFGATFGVNALSQDGYTAGRLAGFVVDADGAIQGRYTNGQSAVLGQVILASFSNPQGLLPLGDNNWVETFESGAALVGAPGTASLGVVQASAVEESNVDLTAELVDMIIAQRTYQANAQTIKTQDAILQTLVNIR